jgi:DNA-binding response OmpR family regulator
VPEVMIVSDAEWVRREVVASLPGRDVSVREVMRGAAVRGAVAERRPDLVIVDLQVGKMGGMAVCLDLRLEQSAGRLPHVPVLMLVDRRADVFLARRSGAEGWLVKPLDPIRISRAVRALLAGGTYHDEAYRPPTVPLPSTVPLPPAQPDDQPADKPASGVG